MTKDECRNCGYLVEGTYGTWMCDDWGMNIAMVPEGACGMSFEKSVNDNTEVVFENFDSVAIKQVLSVDLDNTVIHEDGRCWVLKDYIQSHSDREIKDMYCKMDILTYCKKYD